MATKLKLILCGANSTGKTTLAKDWCRKHKDYCHIKEVAQDVTRSKGIVHSDKATSQQFFELQCHIMAEQNRCERSTHGEPFISEGGPDPLVFVYQRMGQKGLDRLLSKPATMECLQRYRESLVVVLCPLPTDNSPQLEHKKQFAQDCCRLLSQYRVPCVCLDVTDCQERLACLEQAIKGKIPMYREHFSRHQPGQVEARIQSAKEKQTTDAVWQSPISVPFHIPLKYTSSAAAAAVSLRTLEITQQSIQCLFTDFEPGKTNRIVRRYGEDNLLLVHFKLSARDISGILLKGIWVNGEEYQFLGCSSDGLKNRKCYLLRGSIADVETALNECGQFSSIKSVSKRLKRIALLFSSAIPTGVAVPPENIVSEQDIEREGLNFTDGCGSVGTLLARRILEGAKVDCEFTEGEDYSPSVLQIRYEGCKGVVMLEPQLNESRLLVRNSMKKFDPGTKPFQEVWLCDHSKPYCYGHLNRQFIMLLSALGIPDDVFLRKQTEHFDRLEKMRDEPKVATEVLLWKNQPDMAARAAKVDKEAFKADTHIQKVLSGLHSKLVAKMDKLSILIPESRNVFGVSDPRGVLEYGECFFRPLIRGQPCTISGKVLVTKNPCYMLGDVRVLRCIADGRVSTLEHLVDCIVFPTRGKRPHPMEIAGSDLDGDQYFVTWDPELIVPRLCKPYDYPSVETTRNIGVTRESIIRHFACQGQSNMMGKINDLYLIWAAKKGVDSEECQRLGMLFSRSVDASKTGDVVKIPNDLRQPKYDSDMSSTSSGKEVVTAPEPVWKKMQQAAEEKRKDMSIRIVDSDCESAVVNEDFVLSLLKDNQLNMSEFKLFQFVERWCAGQIYSEDEHNEKLVELSEFINFGKFTADQQKLAVDAGIPLAVVNNALNKSTLLSPDMIKHFGLHSACHKWHFLFHSSVVNFKWDHMLRALQRYPQTLLVIELSDGVTFGMHFLTRLPLGETQLEAASVATYFFSSHFGYKLRHILRSGYTVYIDSDRLQIYRGGNTQQTFIWFKNADTPKKGTGVEEIVCDRISVDLTRFTGRSPRDNHPLVNKETLLSVEVYVNIDEPISFDVYEASQLNDLPEEIHQLNELEELPISDTEEEEDSATPLEPYTLASALSSLQQCAAKGTCSQFLALMQSILLKEESLTVSNDLRAALHNLLSSMSTKYACKPVAPRTLELLLTIVTSLQNCVQLPIHCLQLLNGLNWVRDLDFTAQCTAMCLDNLRVSCLHDFLDSLTHWELWCSLPSLASLQMADSIPALCQSLLSAHPVNPSTCTLTANTQSNSEENIEVDETNVQHPSSCEQFSAEVYTLQVKKYACHFAHLVLKQYVQEVVNIRKKSSSSEEDTEYSLVKLKAYDVNLPAPVQSLSKDEQHDKSSESRVTKVGFSRMQVFHATKLTTGSYVAISAMTKSKSSTNTVFQEVALGQVSQISRHPPDIVVDVQGPLPHCLKKSATLKQGHWQLRLIGNVTTFRRVAKALITISDDAKSEVKLLPLLVHPDAFHHWESNVASCAGHLHGKPEATITFSDSILSINCHSTTTLSDFPIPSVAGTHLLNPSQLRAVEAALSQRLTLIHGPPGTGKTYVACHIVRRLCSRGSFRSGAAILVAAETNMAVDNLTRQLLQFDIRVVRVGRREQIARDIHSASLEQQMELKQEEAGKRRHLAAFPDAKLAKEILLGAEVVATTCSGAGDSLLTHSTLTFPFVLIDEATLVTEPVSLVAVVQGCQQLVLIGDPQQLSPLLFSGTLSSDTYGPHVLSMTLFHRMRKVLPSFFLEEQHRMHPKLAEFPSAEFYSGKLKSAADLSGRHSRQITGIKDERIVFVDVTGSHERRVGASFSNPTEARAIADLVTHLLNNEVSLSELAVLTPYTAQVRCIREAVTPRIEICTVDSFQGREKDIIIFSTVRSNQDGNLGFTDDACRMNVLLTRARHHIVGVGCRHTLCQGSALWKRWLEHASLKEITEFQCDAKASKTSGKRGGQGAASHGSKEAHLSSSRHDNSHHSEHRRGGGRQCGGHGGGVQGGWRRERVAVGEGERGGGRGGGGGGGGGERGGRRPQRWRGEVRRADGRECEGEQQTEATREQREDRRWWRGQERFVRGSGRRQSADMKGPAGMDKDWERRV